MAIAFNWLGQYASSPGNRAYCYTEHAISSLAVAETTTSTHCTYPQRDVQAELIANLIRFHHWAFLPHLILRKLALKITVALSTVCNTPPWLLARPATNFSLHSSDKGNTPPGIFKSRLYKLCNQFNNYYHIFTNGSKVGDKVVAAVVYKLNSKSVRLPNNISVFRVELYALVLIDVVCRSREQNVYYLLFIVAQ